MFCTVKVELYNNNINNGYSSNWKSDWARLLGRSYVVVVRSNSSQFVNIDQTSPSSIVKPESGSQKFSLNK